MITLNHGNVRMVDVEFKKPWMGNPKKARKTFNERLVKRLVDQGTVKIVDQEYLNLLKGKSEESQPKKKPEENLVAKQPRRLIRRLRD